jgi:muramoyltetrapeptide carboxypeptidase
MNPKPLKPRRLKEGDLVGVIAPAGPVTGSEIQPGIDLLSENGYQVLLGPHLYDENSYMAGEDRNRIGDFLEMITNPEVKGIFCARGGYGCLRILEKIDAGLVRENPKIIVGYSDITALLLAFFHATGLVTIHGPMVREFARHDQKGFRALLNLLTTEKPYTINMEKGRVLQGGKVEGFILGGNLSLVSSLVGTGFLPSLEGAILFLEERGEALYRIDRMLTQLRISGALEGIKGIIAGHFVDCGDAAEVGDLFAEVIGDPGLPIVTGLPMGHGEENIPLPIGLTAELDSEAMTLSFGEPCTVP